jgi:hypothetical protein
MTNIPLTSKDDHAHRLVKWASWWGLCLILIGIAVAIFTANATAIVLAGAAVTAFAGYIQRTEIDPHE